MGCFLLDPYAMVIILIFELTLRSSLGMSRNTNRDQGAYGKIWQRSKVSGKMMRMIIILINMMQSTAHHPYAKALNQF
jgi:hypothetical protein